MNENIYTELKQSRPPASLEHAAQLSIIRTGLLLQDAFEQALKPYDITATQFNVLRILRGAGTDGLCRNEIGNRMINRMPDMTRLLDRLEDAGLIERKRSEVDRRMVRTRLTEAGHRLLMDTDAEVEAEQKRPFSGLDEAEVNTLIRLLAIVRGSM